MGSHFWPGSGVGSRRRKTNGLQPFPGLPRRPSTPPRICTSDIGRLKPHFSAARSWKPRLCIDAFKSSTAVVLPFWVLGKFYTTLGFTQILIWGAFWCTQVLSKDVSSIRHLQPYPRSITNGRALKSHTNLRRRPFSVKCCGDNTPGCTVSRIIVVEDLCEASPTC